MKPDPLQFLIMQTRFPERNGICIEDLIASIVTEHKQTFVSPVTITDLRTADFVYVSENIKNLIGYTREEVMKDKIILSHHILHPEDTERIFNVFEDIFNFYFSVPLQERLNYKFCNDLRFKKRDGSFFGCFTSSLF